MGLTRIRHPCLLSSEHGVSVRRRWGESLTAAQIECVCNGRNVGGRVRGSRCRRVGRSGARRQGDAETAESYCSCPTHISRTPPEPARLPPRLSVQILRRVIVMDAANIEAESTFWAGLMGGTVHRAGRQSGRRRDVCRLRESGRPPLLFRDALTPGLTHTREICVVDRSQA